MPTDTDIERTAHALADRNGWDWQDLNAADRYLYIRAALRKLASTTVVFPINVKPSYCMQQTNSYLVGTPHGVMHVQASKPIRRQWYVCRNHDGDRVYAGAGRSFVDQPCGPECVNQ